MGQPEGFVQEEKKHIVCKLNKVLYRLKQLLRVWYHCIVLFFIKENFCRNQADHTLYVKKKHVSICSWQSSMFDHIGKQCNPIEMTQIRTREGI